MVQYKISKEYVRAKTYHYVQYTSLVRDMGGGRQRRVEKEKLAKCESKKIVWLKNADWHYSNTMGAKFNELSL